MWHVRNDLELGGHLAANGIVEAARMELRSAHVAITDVEQDGNGGLVGIAHRIHAGHGLSLQDALHPVLAPCGPDSCKVSDRRPCNGALVGAVGANGGSSGGEATIGITEDCDALGIGDALLHQPGGAVILVVLHCLAPLRVAGQPQCPAKAV